MGTLYAWNFKDSDWNRDKFGHLLVWNIKSKASRRYTIIPIPIFFRCKKVIDGIIYSTFELGDLTKINNTNVIFPGNVLKIYPI